MVSSIRPRNPWPPAGRPRQMEVDIFARGFFFTRRHWRESTGGLRARARYSRPDADHGSTTTIKEDFMDRTANAVWKGNLKEGKGTLDTQSAALKATPYS